MIKSAAIALLVGFVIRYICLQCIFDNKTVLVTTELNTSYDYVIVGSGSAGSVLASRLSERHDISVLLLEVGGHFDEHPSSHIPGHYGDLLHSELDWDYYTEPQKFSSLALKSKQAYWPRGRTLGGSSVTNFMQYNRGSPVDFDEWSDMGCTGWSSKDVLPYFKKSEDMLMPELRDSPHHGTGGPLAVSEGKVSDLQDLYIKAGHELGYKTIDYNAGGEEGFMPYQLNARNGVRSSTSKEFLSLANGRENLHIAIRSFVTKIKIDKKRASGVYVIRNGRKQFFKANKEVIVAAGAVNSPQLLMLSGIGRKEHLKALNIPLLADLPVGDNLQDHLRVQMFASIEKPLSVTAEERKSWKNKMKYHLFGTGPIAKTVAEATASFHSNPENRNSKYNYTDVQMNFFSTNQHGNGVNMNDDTFKEIFRNNKRYGFMTALIMNHLKSTGTIRLRSTDPFDTPMIEPNYLSDKQDIEDFVKAIKIWETIVETPTMKSLGTSMEQMRISVCKQHEFRSNAFWECYVRQIGTTTYHPCCTCKMGAKDDKSTVVDPSLRVKGIQGLRVVDASVFPKETSGNLNAPTIMLAEKASDIILNNK